MSVAHRFHELTGYTEDRHWLLPAADPMIRQDFWPMSDAARPPTSKSYPSGLQRIRLPAETAASRDSSAVIGISELSWLLHWSAGVIRQRVDDSGRLIRFRAACSAGNLQPIEVYLQATALQALPDGLWYYSPEPHELVRVGGPAATGTAIVLTGVPWRTAWKYAERGYRYVWWDAGSVIAHLELLTWALGIPAHICVTFPDVVVAAAVGAEEPAEIVLAVVELSEHVAFQRPGIPSARGDLGPPGPDFPLIRAVHDASRLENPVRTPAGFPVATPPLDGVADSWAADLIRRRVTSRRFSTVPVSAADLSWSLTAITRWPAWDQGEIPARWRVFAHKIEDLDPGLYDVSEGRLEPVRTADLRADAVASCLDQQAAGDGAYLVLLAADIDEHIRNHGERGYRGIQLFAGMVAGRLQLAAAHLGLVSTPLTVRDDTAARFVPPGTVPLIAVAVGRPSHERLT